MRLGIDLGGSHVGIGLLNEKSEIIGKLEENLNEEEKKQIQTSLVQKIKRNTEQLLQNHGLTLESIEQIGIACPRYYL